jgi:hypothetical protein
MPPSEPREFEDAGAEASSPGRLAHRLSALPEDSVPLPGSDTVALCFYMILNERRARFAPARHAAIRADVYQSIRECLFVRSISAGSPEYRVIM